MAISTEIRIGNAPLIAPFQRKTERKLLNPQHEGGLLDRTLTPEQRQAFIAKHRSPTLDIALPPLETINMDTDPYVTAPDNTIGKYIKSMFSAITKSVLKPKVLGAGLGLAVLTTSVVTAVRSSDFGNFVEDIKTTVSAKVDFNNLWNELTGKSPQQLAAGLALTDQTSILQLEQEVSFLQNLKTKQLRLPEITTPPQLAPPSIEIPTTLPPHEATVNAVKSITVNSGDTATHILIQNDIDQVAGLVPLLKLNLGKFMDSAIRAGDIRSQTAINELRIRFQKGRLIDPTKNINDYYLVLAAAKWINAYDENGNPVELILG